MVAATSTITWFYDNVPRRALFPLFKMYQHIYVPLFNSGNRVYAVNGYEMRLDLTESRMMCARRFGIFEPAVTDVLQSTLSEEGTYVDVGANKGFHALHAASIVGRNGTVFAFEPHPNNHRDLVENIRLNDLSQIETYETALYSDDSTAIVSDTSHSGHGTLSDGNDGYEVQTMTFDTFLAEASLDPADVDLVKIDVEGAGDHVIRGMNDFLDETNDCKIVIEIHNTAERNAAEEVSSTDERTLEWIDDRHALISIP